VAAEVVLPRQGWTMEVGSIVEWVKRDGDEVRVGDVLFRLQSDKAVNDIEALDAGVLRIPPDSPALGVEVPIGTVLAYIVAPGEEVPLAGAASGDVNRGVLGSHPPTLEHPRGFAPGTRPGASPPGPPTGAAAPGPTTGASSAGPTTGGVRLDAGGGANGGRARGPAVSPRARRVARELGVDWAALRGSGSSGRIVERDVRAAVGAASGEAPLRASPAGEEVPWGARPAGEEMPLRASPAVRRRAAELGVELVALARERPGERIELADVEAAAVEMARAAPPPSGRPHPVPSRALSGPGALSQALSGLGAPLPEGEGTRVGRLGDGQPSPANLQPVTGVRRVIAERMALSAATVPAVTLTTAADATEMVALRERVSADSAGTELAVPSYNDLFAKILAVALGSHPEMNASWHEGGIARHAAVHVGIAVETERGLLVPVVRDVDRRSVREITAEVARLIERARAGTATVDDLSGGTITLTNLGRYEIDAFTPIVNPPEAAILGVGRIVAKAVVVDEAAERIAVRKMVALSLTFDHRVVDGGPAARFLQEVKHLVERPHRWALG
jgi:pyruvate/2-oxoglutarate dehydrogenase complex dihydrolipoamide acyltransferase (E2) component